jgi:hypothetical protein
MEEAEKDRRTEMAPGLARRFRRTAGFVCESACCRLRRRRRCWSIGSGSFCQRREAQADGMKRATYRRSDDSDSGAGLAYQRRSDRRRTALVRARSVRVRNRSQSPRSGFGGSSPYLQR